MNPAASTITPDAAARTAWDAVVVGAGPAGTVAATQLARDGRRVLLVERSTFPRHKVCGGCLAPSGVDALKRLNLGHTLQHARALDTLELHANHAHTRTEFAGTRVVARDRFDQQLAHAAAAAGACLLFGARATRERDGLWCHGQHGAPVRLDARVVILATGLAGNPGAATDSPRIRWSPIGVGTVDVAAPDDPPPGTLQMFAGPGGYLGRVRLDRERTDWAAALQPEAARSAGSIQNAVRAILTACNVPTCHIPERWTGTPRLHRHRTPEAGNTLLIGDAAGYVGPITGEGMSWAIGAAEAVIPHAHTHINDSATPGAWTRAHRTLLRRQRRRCACINALALRPALLAGLIRVTTPRRAARIVTLATAGTPA